MSDLRSNASAVDGLVIQAHRGRSEKDEKDSRQHLLQTLNVVSVLFVSPTFPKLGKWNLKDDIGSAVLVENVIE